MPKTIQYVDVVPARAAADPVAQVYRQAKREMGMLPEAVTMFSAHPGLLVATWAPFREALLATGVAPRATKEAVAATVATLNECPYCVDAHTIMLYGSGGGAFATGLLSGAGGGGEPELRAAADWVRAVAVRPAAPVPAPFPAEQAPEILGVLVHFQFLTRVIDVLLDGTFLPGSQRARRVVRKLAGRAMARRIRAERPAGRAVGLPVDAPLPADLSWAAASPGVAAAYAGIAAAVDEAPAGWVPPAVTELVERTLDGWDGRSPGPGRAWLDRLQAPLDETDRPTARLALLTALAPVQTIEADVAAFRVHHPDDARLLALLSWSAFAAARRIGAWAVPPALASLPAPAGKQDESPT